MILPASQTRGTAEDDSAGHEAADDPRSPGSLSSCNSLVLATEPHGGFLSSAGAVRLHDGVAARQAEAETGGKAAHLMNVLTRNRSRPEGQSGRIVARTVWWLLKTM